MGKVAGSLIMGPTKWGPTKEPLGSKRIRRCQNASVFDELGGLVDEIVLFGSRSAR